jgi:bacterioferritin
VPLNGKPNHQQRSHGLPEQDLPGRDVRHHPLSPLFVHGHGPRPPNKHSINDILKESLEFEKEGLALYKELAKLAGEDIALDEFARGMVRAETDHIDEVIKMLRRD